MQLDINECRVLMQLLNNCTFQVQGNVIPILGQIMNKLNQAIELDKQAKEA